MKRLIVQNDWYFFTSWKVHICNDIYIYIIYIIIRENVQAAKIDRILQVFEFVTPPFLTNEKIVVSNINWVIFDNIAIYYDLVYIFVFA